MSNDVDDEMSDAMSPESTSVDGPSTTQMTWQLGTTYASVNDWVNPRYTERFKGQGTARAAFRKAEIPLWHAQTLMADDNLPPPGTRLPDSVLGAMLTALDEGWLTQAGIHRVYPASFATHAAIT